MQFGAAEKCSVCGKTVYPLEMITIAGMKMHKSCFKCKHCVRQLTISNFAEVNKTLYCKTHYEEIFKSAGGKFDQLIAEGAGDNKGAAAAPAPAPTPAAAAPTPAPAAGVAAVKKETEPSPGLKSVGSFKDRMEAYSQASSGSGAGADEEAPKKDAPKAKKKPPPPPPPAGAG